MNSTDWCQPATAATAW